MTVVVDASVALRWYVETASSGAAVSILAGDEALIAPDLIVCEVANAAWKLARAGEISDEHGARIAAAAPSAFARLVPATELAEAAYAMACELDHPVYHCLYLRLAEVEATQMVSADARLLERVRGTRWEDRIRSLSSPARE